MCSGKVFGEFITGRTSPIEIQHRMIEASEDSIMRLLLGRKWCKWFRSGQMDGTGHLSLSGRDVKTARVEEGIWII
jgi:hypothetical protein